MAGRGEKSLLITTCTFSKDARGEASRDSASPVELIDGDDLCDLLKEYEVGVTTKSRVIEEVEVATEFFANL
jgi:restriction system protein